MSNNAWETTSPTSLCPQNTQRDEKAFANNIETYNAWETTSPKHFCLSLTQKSCQNNDFSCLHIIESLPPLFF